MFKRLLLVLSIIVMVFSNNVFADDYLPTPDEVEGISIPRELAEELINDAIQKMPDYYTIKEVVELVRKGEFTGELAIVNIPRENTAGWYLSARKDSFGKRQPYNPFLEGWWGTEYCISNKLNPFFYPKYNADYYLYNMTKAQFDALPREEQLRQLSVNGPAYINCVLDTTANAMANPETSSVGSAMSIKTVLEHPENYTAKEMQAISFGNYYKDNGNSKEPIEWIVLEKQGNKVLLLSKYNIESVKYSNENKDVTWEDCSLRKWLNNDFINIAFNDSEKQKIIATTIENKNNAEYNTNGGNNTTDKIFCLSYEEAKRYFGYKYVKGVEVDEFGFRQMEHNARASTKATSYAKHSNDAEKRLNNNSYWLRSPDKYQYTVNYISSDGVFGACNVSFNNGLRPAMWLEIN